MIDATATDILIYLLLSLVVFGGFMHSKAQLKR